MFTALKKLVGSNEAKGIPPPGVQAMGQSLQRKFAKGVQYNSKSLRDASSVSKLLCFKSATCIAAKSSIIKKKKKK